MGVNNLYLLRFLLSIFVALFHYNLTVRAIHGEFLNNTLLDQGPFAVLVFFVISGYLMSLTGSQIDIRTFYQKRAIRILPLYYMSFSVSVLIYFLFYEQISAVQEPKSLYNLVFPLLLFPQYLHEFDNSFLGFIEVLWSVGVEILFYLIWPYIRRYTSRKLLLLLLLSLGISLFLPNIYVNYSHFFLIGVLLERERIKIRNKAIFYFLIVWVVLFRFYFILDIRFLGKIIDFLSVISVFLITISLKRNLDNISWIKTLGDASYPLYLFHFFPLYLFIYLWHENFSFGLTLILFVLTSTLISMLLVNVDKIITRKIREKLK